MPAFSNNITLSKCLPSYVAIWPQQSNSSNFKEDCKAISNDSWPVPIPKNDFSSDPAWNLEKAVYLSCISAGVNIISRLSLLIWLTAKL